MFHPARLKGVPPMNPVEVYIKQITEQLQNCNDLSLLDFIAQLLAKSS